MVRAPALLLASVAGSAAAALTADVSSLVQRASQLQAGREPVDSACECVGWHDAYNEHGMKCGWGRELDIAADSIPGPIAAMIPQLSFEFCQMYFGNLPNDRYCMNNRFGARPTEWCYVRPGCSKGYKAQKDVQGSLYVKNCSRDEDATLGEMKFEELAAYVYKNKLELGLAVQYAFPTWHVEKLPDMQAFWGLQAPADAAPMGEGLRQRLKWHVGSGKTVFITSRSGHPPFAVSEGEKLYYINFNPVKAGFDRKEDMNLWACVAGCGAASKPIW